MKTYIAHVTLFAQFCGYNDVNNNLKSTQAENDFIIQNLRNRNLIIKKNHNLPIYTIRQIIATF